MSIWVDKKYINMISGSLDQFKWKRDTLAITRCPICGDSQRYKNKTRGYFFINKGSFIYKCHNCNYAGGVYQILNLIQPSLCKEYMMESFGERNTRKYSTDEPKYKFDAPVFTPSAKNGHNGVTKISDLPGGHPARMFIHRRKIPKNNLFYTDDFKSYIKTINSEVEVFSEPRIIIPIIDEHGIQIGAQGRVLDNNNPRSPKYITIKVSGYQHKLWYGLQDIDINKPTIIVEGPIDSLFVVNAIAMLGIGGLEDQPPKLKLCKDLTYVFDNEPRNKEIVHIMNKIIQEGNQICIWPDWMKHKDINDMVCANESYSSSEGVTNLIQSNTYCNLEANLIFNEWKKQ